MIRASMASDFAIEVYEGDLHDLQPLFSLSTGIDDDRSVKRLIDVEVARGTIYLVGRVGGAIAGFVGVAVDPTGRARSLEPGQVIDLAIYPKYRRKGYATELMRRAERQAVEAGEPMLWLTTDGQNAGLTNFYVGLGYRLVSVVPDWYGPGTAKAYYRKDLGGADGIGR